MPSLIDGTSAGVWQKQAGAVSQAVASLNTSSAAASVTTRVGMQSSVQRAARAVAGMPQLRTRSPATRRIIW